MTFVYAITLSLKNKYAISNTYLKQCLILKDTCHSSFLFSSGEAISLDSDLKIGRSQTCDTFNNKPLCSPSDFTCTTVEVYAFQENAN